MKHLVVLVHSEFITSTSCAADRPNIGTAEALGRFGTDDDLRPSLDVLLKYAQPQEDVFLGIAAWNALDVLDERALPALKEIEAISPIPERSAQRTAEYAGRIKPTVLSDLQ